MAEDGSVVIKIEGDDSDFQQKTQAAAKNLEKMASKMAQQGQSAGQAFAKAWKTIPQEVQRSGDSFSVLSQKLEHCTAEMETEVTACVREMYNQFQSVGGNLSAGLWAGLSASRDTLIARVRSWCGDIVTHVKSVFDIHSPSRVMREQVGRMIAMGIRLGIEDEADGIRAAIGAMSDSALDFAKDEARNYQELGERYVANLKYGIETARDVSASAMEDWVNADVAAYEARVDANTNRVVKAKKALMDAAGDARKQALREEIDAVQDAAQAQKQAYENAAHEVTKAYKNALDQGYDEALALVESRVTSITEQAQKQYDTIQNSIEKLENRLREDDLFSIDKKTGSMDLTDWEDQTEQILEYGEALEQLRELGASDDFLSQVTSLDMTEGERFVKRLLHLSEDDFAEYLENWQTQRDTAKKVAQEFYQDQLTTLREDFTGQLDAALATIPDTMTNLGVDSVKGIIQGLYSESGSLSAAAEDIINRAIAAMKTAADIHSPSKKTRDLIGKNMAAGISQGFTQEMQTVYGHIQSALSNHIADMSAHVQMDVNRQVAANNSSAASPNVVVQAPAVQNETKVEFAGNLSALGRILRPVIVSEQKRSGRNFVKGER